MDLNTLIERQYALQLTDRSVSSSSTRYILNIGLEKVGVLFDFNPEIADYIFKLIKEDLRKKKQEKDLKVKEEKYPNKGQLWNVKDLVQLVELWCSGSTSEKMEGLLKRPWYEISAKVQELLGREIALFARSYPKKSTSGQEVEELLTALAQLHRSMFF
jgi:hypothetical protein